MRRRSKTSKRAKARGRKANTPKHGNSSTISRLRRELNEANEQRAATTDLLKVISRAPFSLSTWKPDGQWEMKEPSCILQTGVRRGHGRKARSPFFIGMPSLLHRPPAGLPRKTSDRGNVALGRMSPLPRGSRSSGFLRQPASHSAWSVASQRRRSRTSGANRCASARCSIRGQGSSGAVGVVLPGPAARPPAPAAPKALAQRNVLRVVGGDMLALNS